MKDPMLKRFMQTLEPGKSYAYADISAMMQGFIAGWNAREEFAEELAAGKDKRLSFSALEKERLSVARRYPLHGPAFSCALQPQPPLKLDEKLQAKLALRRAAIGYAMAVNAFDENPSSLTLADAMTVCAHQLEIHALLFAQASNNEL